jgi:hypothetical protein
VDAHCRSAAAFHPASATRARYAAIIITAAAVVFAAVIVLPAIRERLDFGIRAHGKSTFRSGR